MSRHKMPHNNRVSGSIALRTNDMWSKTIGHNPYANQAEEESAQADGTLASNSSIAADHLMLLAKMSNLSGVESRGGCKKCGALGHMTFQCRNQAITTISKANDDDTSSSSSDSDSDNDDGVDSKLKNPPASNQTKSHDTSGVGAKRTDGDVSSVTRINRDKDHHKATEGGSSSSSDKGRVKRTRSRSESEDAHRHRHKKSKHSKKSKKHKHKDKHSSSSSSKHKKHHSSD